MPTNTFANGLLRIAPSLGNGDPTADNASTAVTKINSNFQKSVVLGGAWVGSGLTWVNNQLVLSNAPNQIIIGNSSYLLSNEFITSGGSLSLNNVPISKLSGQLTPSSIGLSNGTILVGGNQGQGRALELDLSAFTVAGDVLSLREVPNTAFGNSSITAGKLNLPPNSIPIGSTTTGAGSIPTALGPMFSVTNGVLNVITPNTVSYTNLVTTSNFLGTNVRLLTASLNGEGQNVLSWQDSTATIAAAIDLKLAAERSAKAVYVDVENGNDSFTNNGGSRFTPFKSILRATIEVARRSYTPSGANAFSTSVIYILSGTHAVDNRPGTSVVGANSTALDLDNLLLANGLNYFNPPGGGVIVPRGCSVKGVDLRNCVTTPIYVPDATSVGATDTAIFKITGGCFINQLAILDNANVQRSHHLVNAFTFVSAQELSLYYQKIYAAFAILDNLSTPNLVPNILETQMVADTASNAVDPNGYPAVNSVNGASPYVYNVSLRSRFGMCGIFADGSKVTGFKSIVAAQFTCVSNQVDENAYVSDPTDPIEGKDYKPNYRHYAFKVTNDAYSQLVSCFVIAAGTHYWSDSGGQISISNSTSDFGGISLYSSGSSTLPLLQDSGLAGVRLIPPTLIENDVRELIVGSLDSNGVTETNVTTANILNVAPVKFVNSSYIYLRIPSPTTLGQTIDLQAALVSVGQTYTSSVNATPGYFTVTNSPGQNTVNSIYEYINCLGDYRFESSWYNAANPPVGGLSAALETEITRRKSALNGANIFVRRVAERRTNDSRNYHLLITVPSSARRPTINYLLDHPLFLAANRAYFIAEVVQIDQAELVGETNCSSLPGTIYKVTLLRANRPDTETGKLALIGDRQQDLELSETYASQLANLDPRLFISSGLDQASVDSQGASYLTMLRLLTDLGYSQSAITALLAPSANGTLVQRYRCLPTLGTTVVNSAFSFNLLRPSLIRCSNHTWEWVGYRNYNTALPNLQQRTLSIGQSLAALQTTITGGQIYATGMDELGNFYQGRNVLSLATNSSQTIRFDGLQPPAQSTGGSNSNTFADLLVTGTLTATNTVTQNLRATLVEFQPSAQLTSVVGSNILPLTDATTPLGIVANPNTETYGLVRAASNAEVTAFTGNGYLRPQNIAALDSRVGALENGGGSLTVSLASYSTGSIVNWSTNFGVIPSGWAYYSTIGGQPPIGYHTCSSNMFVSGQDAFADPRICHSIMRDRAENYTAFEMYFTMLAKTTGDYIFQLASVANGNCQIDGNNSFPEAGQRNDFVTYNFTAGKRIDIHIDLRRFDNFQYFFAWQPPNEGKRICGYPEIQAQGNFLYTIIKL